MIPRLATLVDILRWRSANQAGDIALRFLTDGEQEEVVITYTELDQRARSIAARLQAVAGSGDRALLLFPPGPDFVCAFFGCLYAGIIAVPAYPPHPLRPEKGLAILQRIAADVSPSLALIPEALYPVMVSGVNMIPEMSGLSLIVIEKEDFENAPNDWQKRSPSSEDIAFLQYTSGSTTLPKGVIIRHGNLLHNLMSTHDSFSLNSESHCLLWLPPYHDMGLIGGILQPVFSGVPVTLMPHLLFLQRPLRWLQAIARLRATVSGGPNFAYDLCIRKIKPEHMERLDLSCWKVAFNGAEPVSAVTMERFADYFAPFGFRREAFFPCYGLAESTLFVSGGPSGRIPPIKHLRQSLMRENRVQYLSEADDDTVPLVSCGRAAPGHSIKIVNAETGQASPDNEIGEIWVSGPSVASGYWNNRSETASTFAKGLQEWGDQTFLRTGDMGFLHEGELYVTGRLKNLIIQEGKNHYPHDIERTVEAAHPLIQQGRSAAFSISVPEGEAVVILVELEHMTDLRKEEILHAVRRAVAENHGLSLYDFRLVAPGGIPRTTSGKIRHFVCRDRYLSGALNEIVAI